MKLFIKNMVCGRCKKAVEEILNRAGIIPVDMELGEITIDGNLQVAQKKELAQALSGAGFELIDDRNSQLIGQIKTMIIQWVHYDAEQPKQKWSELISTALHRDYSFLSRLFSETEGVTIEQYFLLQKIEKVKELMVYGELSLSQIADSLGYSSVAHLSNQFRKITGMTPTYFKSLQHKGRKPLDEVGSAE